MQSLKIGGKILLEPNPLASFDREKTKHEWSTYKKGLFLDRPHIVLSENSWDPVCRTITERYYVIDAQTCTVSRFAQGVQAYSDEEYRQLLQEAGINKIDFYPSLIGTEDPTQKDLFVIVGQK